MRNSIVFILLLIGSAVIELSVMNTLSYPFFLFPLTFSIGILILQMLPISFGILWFLLLPLVLSTLGSEPINLIPYIIVTIAGTILIMRVFTRRSIYALFGLGIILLSLFCIIQTIMGNSLFADNPWFKSFGLLMTELVVALAIGFILVQKLKPFGSLFIFPRKS